MFYVLFLSRSELIFLVKLKDLLLAYIVYNQKSSAFVNYAVGTSSKRNLVLSLMLYAR